MTAIQKIKNRLIDKILASKNEELLSAIESIFESTQKEEKVKLNSFEKELMMLSEIDIEYGNVVSDEELRKSDAKWMK